jgi:hypothetical protein
MAFVHVRSIGRLDELNTKSVAALMETVAEQLRVPLTTGIFLDNILAKQWTTNGKYPPPHL